MLFLLYDTTQRRCLFGAAAPVFQKSVFDTSSGGGACAQYALLCAVAPFVAREVLLRGGGAAAACICLKSVVYLS